MREKYIFFIDIDGTLVNYGETEIKQEIIDEINRLKKLGHIFVIVTGRALQNTLAVKGIDCFQYVGALFGNCIYRLPENKQICIPESLEKNALQALLSDIKNLDVPFSYKDSKDEKTYFTDCEKFKRKKNIKFITQQEYLNDLNSNKIIQLLVLTHIPAEISKKHTSFNYFLMPKNYTDITAKEVAKDKCVKFFKEKYPKMTTVAIGDSLNDLEMLEEAEISIAMGNSDSEIKEKTTYVTKDLTDDGLIYAFQSILKI